MTIQKPKIEFNSSGESGNIYYILGAVQTQLRKQHRITDYNNIRDAVLNSGSYTEALGHIREYIDLVDLDGKY